MVFVRGGPVDVIGLFIGQWKIFLQVQQNCHHDITNVLPPSIFFEYLMRHHYFIIVDKCIYHYYIDDSTFATKVTMVIMNSEYIFDTLSLSYGDNCKWMKENFGFHTNLIFLYHWLYINWYSIRRLALIMIIS